jgi:Amt family ammonium transporter
MDSGDNGWILASAALVMLMTPGLGFFYAGLVRRKNVLATIMHSFFILCLISIVWVLWGYSLAFGKDIGGVVGDLSLVGLGGVGMEPLDGQTISHYTFMVFQMMFAIITVALITGAFAERQRFKAFAIFAVLWSTLVYSPIAHWVWGGGWLSELGALDFAGGTVVHISSGVSALVAALVIGKRFGDEPIDPHDISMTVLGAALLWFGWFGFNAGSALVSGGLAAVAFVNTNTAAAAAALTWMTLSWIRAGRPSVLGAAIGAVAGLVAITPAAGFVTPMAALLIGVGAGVLCELAVHLKEALGVDDALDVWAVHGIGGTWGAIATGIFAVAAVGGASGLVDGNPGQVLTQIIAVLATWVYAGVVTFILLKLIDLTIGLRVSEEEEAEGLDATQHGEIAYTSQI